MATPTEDSFLTVAEIAETLRVNQQTVRNWIDRGELPAIRIGQRRVRVKRADFDRLIERGYTGGQRASTRQTPRMPDHPIPSGPEDPTQGCIVELTKAQLARVQEVDPSHTAELERLGDGWVRLRVFSPDGEIFQEADLPPV